MIYSAHKDIFKRYDGTFNNNVKYKTKHCFESVILIMIVLQILVFKFFDIQDFFNKFIFLIIFVYFIFQFIDNFNKPISKCSIFVLFNIVALLAILFLNGLVFGINRNFISNVIMMIYPLSYLMFISNYISHNRVKFFITLYKLRYVINVYYLINIFVSLVQIKDNTFLVGNSDWVNRLSFDLISGLFGYSMTVVLSFFYISMMIYNLTILINLKNIKRKFAFILYFVITSLISVFILIKSENIGALIIFPILFFIFLIKAIQNTNKKNGFYLLQVSFLVLTVVSVTILFIPKFFTIFATEVLEKVNGLLGNITSGPTVTHGSYERLALVYFGFEHCNGFLLGDGLSKFSLYQPYAYEFPHFGNANAGSFICLIGVWGLLSLFLVYLFLIKNIFIKNDKNTIAISVILLMLISYTIVLTDVSVSLISVFMFVTLTFHENFKYIRVSK